jgi:hypothetical protein
MWAFQMRMAGVSIRCTRLPEQLDDASASPHLRQIKDPGSGWIHKYTNVIGRQDTERLNETFDSRDAHAGTSQFR